jgi:hypothetical protein
MLERLAEALDIEPHDFFTVAPTPQDELERIRQDIRQDIKQGFKQDIIGEVVKAIKETLGRVHTTQWDTNTDQKIK